MAQEESDLTGVFKQQLEQYWKWSQFYHDAEIKVNTAAIAISSIAALSQKVFPNAAIVPALGWHLNIVGFFVVFVSAAALWSTLGYWRSHELCDLYARLFLQKYLPADVRHQMQVALKERFRWSWLSYIPDSAQHMVWIAIQLAFLLLGMFLIVAAPSGSSNAC